jgi:ABC-type uncharacterized transport system permease subunit
MNALFSLVYGQAPLCAGLIAAAYCGLVLHGCLQAAASKPAPWVHSVLIATAAAHTVLLAATVWMPHTSGSVALGLGFAQALSLATCVGVWLFIIESRWVAIDGLRPLALALPAIALVLAAWVTPKTTVLSSGAALHVLVAIAAHGVALLACGHALLLLALNRVLRYNSAPAWGQALSNLLTQHCPPLVVLERLLIRLSVWVAILLALTIVLGVLGGLLKFDHKTILTAMSLMAWLTVAWGYQRRGWRAAKLCVAVFVATGLLLLAYIGTRFVLQAILHR